MGPLLHARNQTAVEALGKSLWFNAKESKVVCFVMSKRDPVNYYLEWQNYYSWMSIFRAGLRKKKSSFTRKMHLLTKVGWQWGNCWI
ncbi:hypothetical protein LAZ67_18001825 [Cordylochernes scorpioides]|uniref:Uncharacterized protein n=1 Tax=Cordylochernes scorpioides TaxID=51811 RepID=A0ABY6LG56_9ARAC|nr:hypothetical protein LAZ67_18001825 [Cordylochernes scorpioides]